VTKEIAVEKTAAAEASKRRLFDANSTDGPSQTNSSYGITGWVNFSELIQKISESSKHLWLLFKYILI
jgi:hypothetical protein